MKTQATLLSLCLSTAAAAQYGPTFPAPQFKTAGVPYELALHDWTGDGRLDAVSADVVGDVVSFAPGLGIDGFGPAVSLGAVNGPLGLAVGDLDGDGLGDFAVVESQAVPRRVVAALSNGAGAFSAVASTVPLAPDDFVVGLALADVDLDGDLDALPLVFPEVVSSPDYRHGWVTVLAGDGTGSFAATGAVHMIGQLPRHAVAGDFDADGAADLAVANGGSNDVSILLGDGVGGFAAAASVPTPAPPQRLALADFDGNGSTDVAVGTTSLTVAVLYGDGAGGFPSSLPIAVPNGSYQIAASDLDGDAAPDIVAGNAAPTVLLNDGAGGFPAAQETFLPHCYSLALADLDADGHRDMLVGGTLGITLLRGDGGGAFGALVKHASSAFGNSAWMESGDLDGDGALDLLFDEFRLVRARLGGGDGTFAPEMAPALLAVEPTSGALADLDQDGALDVAVSEFEFGGFQPSKYGLAVVLGDGAGGLAVSAEPALPQFPASIAAGDLDGDGDPDLAVPLAANGPALPNQVALYGVDAAGALLPGAALALPAGPRDTALVDLDLNGALDVVTTTTAGHVVVHFGTGGGGFGPPVVHFPSVSLGYLRGADIDHDGKPDLVAATTTIFGGNGVAVVPGLGGGALGSASAHVSQYSFVARRPRVDDLDGDGWLDVLAVSKTLELWRGSAAGLGPSRLYAAWSTTDAAAGDWDGDGFVDAAVLSYNQLTVHPNQRAVPPGLAPFGTGTPGCSGAHLALGDGPPAIGTTVTLTCNHAPPLGLGLKVSSLGALDPGIPLLDMLVHVDPLSPILLINVVHADFAGLSRFPVAIPFEPSIQGLVFHKQWFWLSWPALGCMPSASGFSSSRGLTFTIQ